MSTTGDRVDQLLENARPNRRVLVTPEGVPLELSIAGCGERAAAFGIDFAIIAGSVIVLSLGLGYLNVMGTMSALFRALVLLFAFLVRTFYFTCFEVLWQGRTPGKAKCGLRVINRDGGELTSGAVIARNLIREVEFFLPLSLLLTLDADAGAGKQLALVAWVLLVASLPLWNRDRLRPGDIIAGTQVIAMPKRELSRDLTLPSPVRESGGYAFTREELSKYGAFELQVLEELLRRPESAENARLLEDICRRICRKIGRTEEVSPAEVRHFLTDFYTAERGELERGKLFGRLREDKNSHLPAKR